MKDIGEVAVICCVIVFPYLLLGSFWAYLLGLPQGTFAWGAVVLLWPVIGLMLLIVGGAIASMLGSIVRSARQ